MLITAFFRPISHQTPSPFGSTPQVSIVATFTLSSLLLHYLPLKRSPCTSLFPLVLFTQKYSNQRLLNVVAAEMR
jgi:hypothetical protein